MLDFVVQYEERSTTALSANPAVAVPLLTISGWILMQRKAVSYTHLTLPTKRIV